MEDVPLSGDISEQHYRKLSSPRGSPKNESPKQGSTQVSLQVSAQASKPQSTKNARTSTSVVLPPTLYKRILSFVPDEEIAVQMSVSFEWFSCAIERLYGVVAIKQLSRKRLERLIATLTQSQYGYKQNIKSLSIEHITADDSPFQPFSLVATLLALCPSLTHLRLSISDSSFSHAPAMAVTLPQLTHINISAKQPIPEILVTSLLRGTASLSHVTLNHALSNPSASLFYLIAEKGNQSLIHVTMSPPIGANTLGWDSQILTDGLMLISQTCTNMQEMHLPSHSQPLDASLIQSFLTNNPCITHLTLPCNQSDMTLSALTQTPLWRHLKTLNLACYCADGLLQESIPNGSTCSTFSESLIQSLMNHVIHSYTIANPDAQETIDKASSEILVKAATAAATAASNSNGSPTKPTFHEISHGHLIELVLPVHIISVKSGKRILTSSFLASIPHCIRASADAFIYKGILKVSAPSERHLAHDMH